MLGREGFQPEGFGFEVCSSIGVIRVTGYNGKVLRNYTQKSCGERVSDKDTLGRAGAVRSLQKQGELFPGCVNILRV